MFNRNWMRLKLSILISVSFAYAQSLPQPPCWSDAWPSYPEVDQRPVVKVWENADWRPPQCTGWREPGSAMLVATVARFRYPDGRDGLLRRIGDISSLKGIEYWSTTRQQWSTLIVDASGPSGTQLTPGRRFPFIQEDSVFGKGEYELRVDEASPDRIVFDVTNMSALRFLMLPVFQPGEVQSIYFLDHEAKDVWRYYNLGRTRNANPWFARHAASAISLEFPPTKMAPTPASKVVSPA